MRLMIENVAAGTGRKLHQRAGSRPSRGEKSLSELSHGWQGMTGKTCGSAVRGEARASK